MRPRYINAGPSEDVCVVRISIGSKLGPHNITEYGCAGKTIKPFNNLLGTPAPVVSGATTGQLLQDAVERAIAASLSTQLQVGGEHHCRARPVDPHIDTALTDALVRTR